MGMSPPASFGRPAEETPDPVAAAMAAMTMPALNLGQVQAELVLTVSEQSLHAIGEAVANAIANATVQGFAAGWEHVTGEPFRAPGSDTPPT